MSVHIYFNHALQLFENCKETEVMINNVIIPNYLLKSQYDNISSIFFYKIYDYDRITINYRIDTCTFQAPLVNVLET